MPLNTLDVFESFYFHFSLMHQIIASSLMIDT